MRYEHASEFSGGRQSEAIPSMKISARNVLEGTVVSVEKGVTTDHVTIAIGPGQVVTAAITHESVDALGPTVGGEACAVARASDIMMAVD